MPLDIRKAALAKTGVMQVKEPSGEALYDDEKPCTITFHSPSTKQYQRAQHAREEKANNRAFSRMQGNSDAKQSSEDKLNERAEFLAACTISFDNWSYDGGSGGYETFKKFYADLDFIHVAEQAAEFLASKANFSSKSRVS